MIAELCSNSQFLQGSREEIALVVLSSVRALDVMSVLASLALLGKRYWSS